MTVCYILAQAQGKISALTACLSVIYSDYGSGAIGCDPDDLRDL